MKKVDIITENTLLKKALKLLIEAKQYKEKNGKDAVYTEMRDRVWKEAIKTDTISDRATANRGTIYEVHIANINVDKKYFFFDYIVLLNGEEKDKGQYESDHAWDNLEEFKTMLKEGYAVELAIGKAIG